MLTNGHPQVVVFMRLACSVLSHSSEVRLRSGLCQGSGLLPFPGPLQPSQRQHTQPHSLRVPEHLTDLITKAPNTYLNIRNSLNTEISY